MPEMLSLEWDEHEIHGLQAQLTAESVSVKRCFVLRKPAERPAGATPLEQGTWLKQQLTALGITTRQVLITLPRDAAVVKRLELPDAPDAELPLLVRFQAGTKSSVSVDELCLDFLPLPRRDGKCPVLMATVPRQVVNDIRAACTAAGLEIASFGLTPVAVGELLARSKGSSASAALETNLVVSRHGKRVEISIFAGRFLVFSHAARLVVEPDREQQAIVAEVSRALVALRGQSSETKIDRVWLLIGPADRETLLGALQQRLNCAAQELNSFAGA